MNNQIKLTIGVIIAFTIVISIIMTASSILKDEAVNNYLTISKLNAKASSKELNQDLSNIEQMIKNISSILDLYNYNININSALRDIQRNYPQIRSINILKDSNIKFSSNKDNIGIFIDNINFFPKPIFDENILKISTPWVGRDFIDGSDIYNYEEIIDEKDSFFIPISKKINSKKGSFNIIVNLNNDYFINRFLTNINSKEVIFELIRLDGILLSSTENSKLIGKKIKDLKLLERTIEKNELTGIEIIDNTKYITTYILTDNYPINLAVKLDYDKSLTAWNKKQYNFFIITTATIIITMLIALFLFYLYNKGRQKEIKLHKLQLEDKERFELLFQDSHFLSAVIDENGLILDINNCASNFLNQSIENLKGRKFWDLDCWDIDEKNYLRKIFTSGDNEKNIEVELKALTSEKEQAIIDFSLYTIHKTDIFNYIAIGQDITERKEREKKLKQAYSVFNNTNDGIMITDRFSNIIDVNKSFELITGYIKDEIINQNTRILKSNKHSLSFYENMWKNITENGHWEGEIINLKKDGSLYTEWLTINVILDKDGYVQNYIGIFSDITEQKNKDEKLKENEKLIYQQSKMAAMGEMIENIAHQWRQPLSVISTAASGIKVQKELSSMSLEEEFKRLDAINESAQFLSETIENFRNYLKNTREKESFLISDAIDDSIKLINSKLKNRGIKIIKSNNNIFISGVRNEFIQVIINLISNAQDALELSNIDDRYIFIESFIEEDKVKLIVKDNAGGISDEIIDRVFEPYFTTKHQSQGTGIGLYMSSEIIKNHMNGSIKVSNKYYIYNNKEFKGACFEIILPTI